MPKLKMSRSMLLGLAIVVVTLMVVVAMMKLRPHPPKVAAPEKAVPVQVVTLKASARTPQLRLLGQLETPYQSQLSAAVSAVVTAIPVLEGDRVQQGQQLVQLDDRDAQYLVDQRHAAVADLQAQSKEEQNRQALQRQDLKHQQNLVKLAEKAVKRQESLSKSQVASQANLDQARQSLEGAHLTLNAQSLLVSNQAARTQALDAKLDQAKALLAQARLDLERSRVLAPFNGIVTHLAVAPGERVRVGDPLVTLYSTDQQRVRAQLPMDWVATARQALAQGQPMTATASLFGDRYQLVLDRLSGQVNPGAGGVDALFRFEQPDRVPAALNKTLNLVLDLPAQDRLFAIPVAALYGTDRIYRIRDQRLQGLQVQVVGQHYAQGRQSLLIRSEQLQDGDQVVATQLANAINGLKVDIRGEVDAP